MGSIPLCCPRCGESRIISEENSSGKDCYKCSSCRLKFGNMEEVEKLVSRLMKFTFEVKDLFGNYISMIFQEPMTALNPVFRIGAQIDEVIALHEGEGKTKEDIKKRTIEMLENHMHDIYDSYAQWKGYNDNDSERELAIAEWKEAIRRDAEREYEMGDVSEEQLADFLEGLKN